MNSMISGNRVLENGMPRYPTGWYRCPDCNMKTGFKRVPKGQHGDRYGPDEPQSMEPRNIRGSCRNCGFIREGARDG